MITPRSFSLLLLLALLAFATAACRDGSDDDIVATILPSTPEASPTAGEAEPGSTPTEATTPDAGEPTPAPTMPPDVGDGLTPSPDGTPAVGPADLSAYEGETFPRSECAFDPQTGLANCPGYGIYSVSPVPTGQDISCSVFISGGEAILVFCRSASPMQATYYEIQ